MREYFEDYITQLEKNEVFVFGSNLSGFHGAGAAGQAFRGDGRNTWRQDEAFIKAINSLEGSQARIGKWAVYGIGKGFQTGHEGSSYAIATVTKPGAKRSISLNDILIQLIELGQFARLHPELKFYCAITGGGYNGYTVGEIRNLYKAWVVMNKPPYNIIFPANMKEGKYELAWN